jgi:hypothetical protein
MTQVTVAATWTTNPQWKLAWTPSLFYELGWSVLGPEWLGSELFLLLRKNRVRERISSKESICAIIFLKILASVLCLPDNQMNEERIQSNSSHMGACSSDCLALSLGSLLATSWVIILVGTQGFSTEVACSYHVSSLSESCLSSVPCS